MRRATLAHRVEYALFAAAAATVRALPARSALATGAGLARLGWWPLRIRRTVVEANLRAAFPDHSAKWVRATAAEAYAHIGRETVALLRAAGRTGRAHVDREADIEGAALIGDALALGNGVLVLTAHFGNWELGAASLAALGATIDIVVQRQRNPLFDRALIEARRGLGVSVIDRGAATREGVRSLRDNHVLVLAPDQNAGRSGLFLPFFGRPASTTRGPAILAVRAAAPVLMSTAVRAPDGRLRVRLRSLAGRVPRSESAITGVMSRYLAVLEAAIRETPTQYFWHHRRWKTRPPPEVD
ncbi:MAG: lysophospholipid acyltransferase family protein [Gemmatimonadetes bacterium]|nr:lysophospholipid acyltransferase family protein [Gemmatimonadota bacterium]